MEIKCVQNTASFLERLSNSHVILNQHTVVMKHWKVFVQASCGMLFAIQKRNSPVKAASQRITEKSPLQLAFLILKSHLGGWCRNRERSRTISWENACKLHSKSLTRGCENLHIRNCSLRLVMLGLVRCSIRINGQSHMLQNGQKNCHFTS